MLQIITTVYNSFLVYSFIFPWGMYLLCKRVYLTNNACVYRVNQIFHGVVKFADWNSKTLYLRNLQECIKKHLHSYCGYILNTYFGLCRLWLLCAYISVFHTCTRDTSVMLCKLILVYILTCLTGHCKQKSVCA